MKNLHITIFIPNSELFWSGVFGVFPNSAERDNCNHISGTLCRGAFKIQSKIFFADIVCSNGVTGEFCGNRNVNVS